MDTKNEISDRFIEAYNRLLATGKVTDKKDFAAKIGISASMVTEISKGRSSVGITAIQNIVSIFEISANWLLTGKEEICEQKEETDIKPINQAQYSPPDQSSALLSLIHEKDIVIREQAEEIGRLREQIEHLERRREKAALDAQTSGAAHAG